MRRRRQQAEAAVDILDEGRHEAVDHVEVIPLVRFRSDR
jgi:hypothetical protein